MENENIEATVQATAKQPSLRSNGTGVNAGMAVNGLTLTAAVAGEETSSTTYPGASAKA